jgi:hypothetical protein
MIPQSSAFPHVNTFCVSTTSASLRGKASLRTFTYLSSHLTSEVPYLSQMTIVFTAPSSPPRHYCRNRSSLLPDDSLSTLRLVQTVLVVCSSETSRTSRLKTLKHTSSASALHQLVSLYSQMRLRSHSVLHKFGLVLEHLICRGLLLHSRLQRVDDARHL